MRGLLSALLLCSVLLLSGQESYTTATESPPEVSVPLSEKLDAMATTLERALSDSATDWDDLSRLLTSLYQKLTESATSSKDLEREIKYMQTLLNDLRNSLSKSNELVQKRENELRIWQSITCVCAGATIGACLDRESFSGCAIGITIGAVGAGAIWLFSVRLP
jgi:septal ring factor EnvC (AmiA/AmiB activator)